ncbi:hypothetical protein FACS1894205_3120 [Alphaproteobacteria bacterium]|nr:hypothetical protein FACS1894205_3120 [Alphaproteobacteria bacterium]
MEENKDVVKRYRKLRADLKEGANRAGMTLPDYLETEEADRILDAAVEVGRKNPTP